MRNETNWRGVTIIFIITTIFFGVVSIFLASQKTPPHSYLEKYLKQENDILKTQQDSLFSIIRFQNNALYEKDKALQVLASLKDKIKIVYYEKYQKIDGYSIRQLTAEFDSIFANASNN
jgi:hypothetical protein